MKFLCDACSRLVDVTRFTVDGGVLRLRCPVCDAESHNAATPGSRAIPREMPRDLPPRDLPREAAVIELVRPAPRRSPEELCPKCAALRSPQGEACPKCGLVYALYQAETFALPEQVEALWGRCEQAWSEPRRHEEFLSACAIAGLLPEAARRYRLQAEQRPDDPVAARYRDETVSRLMAMCMTEPSAPRTRTASSRPLLLLLFLVFATLVGYGLYQVVSPLAPEGR